MRNKIEIFLLFLLIPGFFTANSDSLDIFKKNKISVGILYNQPLISSLYVDNPKYNLYGNKVENIYLGFYPNIGFRFSYSLNIACKNKMYHHIRFVLYLHDQHIDYDVKFLNKNTIFNYDFNILNLVIMPEYSFLFRLNKNHGLKFNFGYNFSYTMYYYYEYFKEVYPTLVNKYYYFNNYQTGASWLIKLSTKNLLEFGFYWNTNPLWNKYMGIMAGVSF